LLDHKCSTIDKGSIHHPGSDFTDRIFAQSNRSIPEMRSLQQLYGHGRLANTGYVSILPVDQGIEPSAGESFAKKPKTYSDYTNECPYAFLP
jgi:class I fructose-bisphosphate aldolase